MHTIDTCTFAVASQRRRTIQGLASSDGLPINAPSSGLSPLPQRVEVVVLGHYPYSVSALLFFFVHPILYRRVVIVTNCCPCSHQASHLFKSEKDLASNVLVKQYRDFEETPAINQRTRRAARLLAAKNRFAFVNYKRSHL